MPRRGAIAGVLHNLLASLTSRNADLDGYWIFGVAPAEAATLDVDLLARGPGKGSPDDAVACLAQALFREQLAKARLKPACVRAARLSIGRSPAASGDGGDLVLRVEAISDLGRAFCRCATIAVEPVNPRSHMRSTRAPGHLSWGRSSSRPWPAAPLSGQ